MLVVLQILVYTVDSLCSIPQILCLSVNIFCLYLPLWLQLFVSTATIICLYSYTYLPLQLQLFASAVLFAFAAVLVCLCSFDTLEFLCTWWNKYVSSSQVSMHIGWKWLSTIQCWNFTIWLFCILQFFVLSRTSFWKVFVSWICCWLACWSFSCCYVTLLYIISMNFVL